VNVLGKIHRSGSGDFVETVYTPAHKSLEMYLLRKSAFLSLRIRPD
jgi:hypothetical protein